MSHYDASEEIVTKNRHLGGSWPQDESRSPVSWRWLGTGAAILALALSACSSSGSSGGSGPAPSGGAASAGGGSGTLVVDLAGGSGTVDPAQACGTFDVDFLGQFYARLTQYGSMPGPDGTTQFDPSNIKPWFATSWKVSQDGRTYTFTLPAGAKFANGDPMDAAAVKYSLNRSITSGGCGSYFILDGLYGPPPLIKSISTPSPTTVTIRLNEADANFAQDLAQPAAGIVDPKVVQANGGIVKGKVNQWMQSHIAGDSGPYELASYTPGTSASLQANPNYFGSAPAAAKIKVNFIGDDSTLLLRARSGEADVTIGLSPQAAHSLVGNSCCKVVLNPTTTSLQIMMPSNHAPLNNSDFRAALSYALPDQQILQKVGYGYGQLFYGPYPPLMKPEYDASQESPRPFSLSKAKSLLARSGVKTPVALNMIIDGSVPVDQQLATIAQASWKPLGVNVTISTLSDANFETKINTNPKPYQLAVTSDGPGVIDAGYYLGYDMLCKSAYNAAGICVPGADKLLNQARATVDPAKRLSLYRQIIPLWTANSPKIPVYARDDITVLGPRVAKYFYAEETAMWTWAG
jgi:peptide/nickel transport system substrate-binding protein